MPMPETIYGGSLTNKRKHELQEIACAMNIHVTGTPKKAALTKLIQNKLDIHKEIYIQQAQFKGLYVSPRLARKPAARRSLPAPVVYPNISYQYGSVPQSDDSADDLYPTWVCAEFPEASYQDDREKRDKVKEANQADQVDRVKRAKSVDRPGNDEDEPDKLDEPDEPIYISSDTETSSEYEEEADGDEEATEDYAIDQAVSSQANTSTVTTTTTVAAHSGTRVTNSAPFITSIPAMTTGTAVTTHLAWPAEDISGIKTTLGFVPCCDPSYSSSSMNIWPRQLVDRWMRVSSDTSFNEHDLLADDDVSDEVKARWEIRKRKAWAEFLWEEDGRLGGLESLDSLEDPERSQRPKKRDAITGWSSRPVSCTDDGGSISSRDETEEVALDELAVEKFLADLEAAVRPPIRMDVKTRSVGR